MQLEFVSLLTVLQKLNIFYYRHTIEIYPASKSVNVQTEVKCLHIVGHLIKKITLELTPFLTPELTPDLIHVIK